MADQFGLPTYNAPTSGYGSTWGTGNGIAAASDSGGGGMGGLGLWAQVGGSFLTGLFGGSAQKKADKRRFGYDWRLQEGAGVISRKNTAFDAELQRYYEQLAKRDKMRGLDEFRKFTTVEQFAPGYQNSNPGPVLPPMPSPNSGVYAPEEV